ncbi:MAG: TonB-dependent receptor [Chitinophagaceae bacterium]|nr:TonB-dependent receptor [Chitinophagaceae bacterium]
MNFIAILLLACCLQISAHASSQGVTLNVKKAPLDKVFREIREQTGYTFMYTETMIREARKVTIQVKNSPLHKVLDICFDAQPFTYNIIDKTVVIQPRAAATATVAIGEAIAPPPPIEIRGRVTNPQGEPLQNVSVLIVGTQTGTVTNNEGYFTLTAPDNKNISIEISSVGYQTKRISVGTQNEINITLEPGVSDLSDVVVIGYGTQKRSDLTGSIITVNMNDSRLAPNVSIAQALQGAAPGLNVEGGGGAGYSPSVSIRGRTSLSASDDPLIVLDGIIYQGSISDININDVESIDVLKDASAAAVYGARSANGVLIISTKKGKIDKPTFGFNGYYGFQDIANNPMKVMTAEPFAIRLVDYYYQQSLYAWYATKPTSDAGRPVRGNIQDRNFVASLLRTQEERDNYLAGYEINWIDEVTQTAPIQDYNVNISGKSERSNYYLSGSYTNQQGVLKNDKFARYTVHANVESKITDWFTLGLNSSYTTRDYSGLSASMLYARAGSPLANKYNSAGSYPMDLLGELYQRHPLGDILIDDQDIRNSLFLVASAKINVPGIKGLTYDFNYSTTRNTSTGKDFYPVESYNGSANNGLAIKNYSQNDNWIINNIATYSRSFAHDHNVNVTLLYSVEERKGDDSRLQAQGFSNPVLGYNNMGLGTIMNVTSNAWQENSLSYMARVNYAYKSRYMITGTVRKDGFSGFGPNKKFATFPSLSLAWVASKEPFFNTPDWLNLLKIRASVGANGNQGIGRYSSFSKMSASAYVYGANTDIGVYPSSLGNTDLGWESTLSYNLGIDYAALNNRITGSIDIYDAKTSDVLVTRTLPNITGYQNIWTNIGGISNKGIELGLTTVNVDNIIRWETRFAFALNRDKITKLYGGAEDKDIGNSWFAGKGISAIYDYKMTGGVWTEDELYKRTILSEFYPGQWRLADLNGDGLIDANNDRSIIGYRTPNYRFSINSFLSYKNFTFSFFINSIQGGNGYYLKNNAAVLFPSTTADIVFRTNTTAIRQYWTPDNGVTNAVGIFNSPKRIAGYYEDRSFARLQDISLSYLFPSDALKPLHISSLQLYISGKNLYTMTKWSGWDPEIGDDNTPMMRSFVVGARVSL